MSIMSYLFWLCCLIWHTRNYIHAIERKAQQLASSESSKKAATGLFPSKNHFLRKSEQSPSNFDDEEKSKLFSTYGCISTPCIGASLNDCPQGRELYRSQFLCVTQSNMLFQVGLSESGDFLYREYNTFRSISAGEVEVQDPTFVFYILGESASSQFTNTQRLVVSVTGSLQLYDFDGNSLWTIQSTSGSKFQLNENGFQFLSSSNQAIWTGPTFTCENPGSGYPEILPPVSGCNGNDDNDDSSVQGCVGTCLGGKLTTSCTHGRVLYKGQFLCYLNPDDQNNIERDVGITTNGDLVYQEYSANNIRTKRIVICSKVRDAEALRMQSDGNLVLRSQSSNIMWSSDTTDGKIFQIDGAGYFITNENDDVVWEGRTLRPWIHWITLFTDGSGNDGGFLGDLWDFFFNSTDNDNDNDDGNDGGFICDLWDFFFNSTNNDNDGNDGGFIDDIISGLLNFTDGFICDFWDFLNSTDNDNDNDDGNDGGFLGDLWDFFFNFTDNDNDGNDGGFLGDLWDFFFNFTDNVNDGNDGGFLGDLWDFFFNFTDNDNDGNDSGFIDDIISGVLNFTDGLIDTFFDFFDGVVGSEEDDDGTTNSG